MEVSLEVRHAAIGIGDGVWRTTLRCAKGHYAILAPALMRCRFRCWDFNLWSYAREEVSAHPACRTKVQWTSSVGRSTMRYPGSTHRAGGERWVVPEVEIRYINIHPSIHHCRTTPCTAFPKPGRATRKARL
jgi:hypothetical protein